jgi:cytochrome c-type biogenesis protein CcmF
MVVHLGIVLIAVAFSASQAFGHRAEFRLNPGESGRVAGHTVTYLGVRTVQHPNRASEVADVRVDGGRVYRPAVSQYPFATQAIGTPSVRTGVFDDVYLTLAATPDTRGGAALIGVIVQPLVVWLWIGGALVAVGTFLAAIPGRRRRPTAPASAGGVPVRRPADTGTPVLAEVPSA